MGGSAVQYYSQYGQDEYLDRRIFKGLRHGVFVDVGASDGVTRSNTYFFEKARGWTGLCIEPREDSFQQLRASRNCRCECVCVSSSPGKRRFLEIEGWSAELSGLIDHYHPRHLERVEKEVAEYGLETCVREVSCLRLADLLRDSGLGHIDLCSIDVEGAELQVLKGIDFEEVTIDVFLLEDPYRDFQVRQFLAANGYRLARRIRHDDVYVRAVSPIDRLCAALSCSRAAWVLSILRDMCSAGRVKRGIGLALTTFARRKRGKKAGAAQMSGPEVKPAGWRLCNLQIGEMGTAVKQKIKRAMLRYAPSVASRVLFRQRFNKTRLLRLLPPDPVILDIGACDGTDSIELRMLFPRATIHCFEPEPSNFQKLLAKTQGLRITCHPLALGAAPGRARFFVSSGLPCASSSSLREPTGHIKAHPNIRFDRTIDVRVACLSDWVQAHGIEWVDFLWMDAQGSELDILRNAGEVLRTVRAIHTEVSLIEFYRGAPLYHEVRDFLLAEGFVVLEDLLGNEAMGDVVFIRKDDPASAS